MAAEQSSSEQVATQVATSTGTSGGSAGNNTTTGTTGTGGTGQIASPTAVVAPKGFRLELQQMLQGWQEVIPSDSTFASSGGSLSQAGVLAQLQEYLGAYTALDTSATAANEARAQVRSQLPEVRAYYASLKAAVATYLGGQGSPQLAKFGLTPRKARAKATSAQLAVRAAKARATRKLRGTQGPVQKAANKSGPMKFVDPVPSGQQPAQAAAAPEQQPAPATTAVASTAPSDPTLSTASPPSK